MPSLSITVTADQATRGLAALGRYLNLRNPDGTFRSATAAEAQAWLFALLRDMTLKEERMARTQQPDDQF